MKAIGRPWKRKPALQPGWKMTPAQHRMYWNLLQRAYKLSPDREGVGQSFEEFRAIIHLRAFGKNISAKDIAPTCVAHYAKDLSTRLVVDKKFPKGVRPFSVREYARLQGVPDSFVWDCSATQAYRMIGNGVSIPVGKWLGNEINRYFN